jgi:hypothetical protein
MAKLLLRDNLSVLVTGVASPGPVRLQAIVVQAGKTDTVGSRDYPAQETQSRLSFRYPLSLSELSNDDVVDLDDFFAFADCFGGVYDRRLDLNADGLVDLGDSAALQVFMDQGAPYDPRYDLDGDGAVNARDFFVLGAGISSPENVQYDPAADIDHDGKVTFDDFFLFVDDFGVSLRGGSDPTRQYWLRISSLAGGFAPVQVAVTSEVVLRTHDLAIQVAAVARPASPTQTARRAALSVTPTALAFGQVTVGDTAADTLLVGNTGDTTLTASLAVSGPGFAGSPTVVSVPAGGDQLVTITFTPNVDATCTGTVEVVSNGGRARVGLTGNGAAAAMPVLLVSTTQVDFDSVVVGQWASRSVAIRNTGTANLVIASINSSSAQMSVSPPSAVVPPGSTIALNVLYSAVTLGIVSSNLVINSNAGAATITANGIGKEPAAPVQPAPWVALATATVGGVAYSAGGGFAVSLNEEIELFMRAQGTTPPPLVEWHVSTDGGASWTVVATGASASYRFTGYSSRARIRGVAMNPNDPTAMRTAAWNVQLLGPP